MNKYEINRKFWMLMIPRQIFIAITLLFLPLTTFAENLISNVINISADSTGYVLVADKTHQKIFIINSDAPGTIKIVKEYKITTGRRSGDKEHRGDLRTPEGIYYIDKRKYRKDILHIPKFRHINCGGIYGSKKKWKKSSYYREEAIYCRVAC